MPEHTTEERNGHLRTTVELEPGERVSLCRCFQSREFPFCDGTHKQLPGNQGPVVVKQAPPEQITPQG
jgi:CDGSH-type Zn-finger protein